MFARFSLSADGVKIVHCARLESPGVGLLQRTAYVTSLLAQKAAARLDTDTGGESYTA